MRRRSLAAALLLPALFSCPPQSPLCTPGERVACSCDNGLTGSQQCAADGRSYAQCVCEAPPPCQAESTQPCTCSTQSGQRTCDAVSGVYGACICTSRLSVNNLRTVFEGLGTGHFGPGGAPAIAVAYMVGERFMNNGNLAVGVYGLADGGPALTATFVFPFPGNPSLPLIPLDEHLLVVDRGSVVALASSGTASTVLTPTEPPVAAWAMPARCPGPADAMLLKLPTAGLVAFWGDGGALPSPFSAVPAARSAPLAVGCIDGAGASPALVFDGPAAGTIVVLVVQPDGGLAETSPVPTSSPQAVQINKDALWVPQSLAGTESVSRMRVSPGSAGLEVVTQRSATVPAVARGARGATFGSRTGITAISGQGPSHLLVDLEAAGGAAARRSIVSNILSVPTQIGPFVALDAIDLDADGNDELVVTSQNGNLSCWLNVVGHVP